MKTTILLLVSAVVPVAASAAPAVPPVSDPVEVGGKPVIDGANGTELCSILKSLKSGSARDSNIFSITPDEYARMSGSQAACIVELVSAVPQIDHVRAEAWARMETKDLLWLLAKWTNGDAKLKSADQWLKAHADVPGDSVLAVLEAIPNGWYRDALILAIAGERYARMQGSVAARIVSLLSSVTNVSKVPREAWARLGHEDLEWLLTKWKNQTLQPKVVQYWMDAHRA